MLSNEVCKPSDELLADVIGGDIALAPISGTPLAELVKTTTTMPLTDLTKTDIVNTLSVLTEESNNSLHNGWTNEVVERAAAVMNRRIDIIKTTVIPAIKNISESVLADVSALGDSEFNFNIVRYSICDAVNIDLFMNDVTRNASPVYFSPGLYFKEANLTVLEILEKLKSGNTVLDDAIAVSVNRIGQENLFRLWESLFVDRTKIAINNFADFNGFVLNPDFGLDYAIIVYQLAVNLQSVSRATSTQYKEAAGFVIVKQLNLYNKAIVNGTLIKSRANANGAIEVYTLNYNTFLQKGGTAEMIIGAANNQNYYYSVTEILEKAQEVEKDYRVIKAASSIEYRQKVRQATVNSLRSNFMRAFKNELSSYEVSFFEKNPGDKSEVIRKFENLLALVSSGTVKDVYRRVTEVVCNSRFFYMDCYELLQTIDQLCEEGNDPNDAFAQAVLGEISNFVVSQIKA
jgi:hypothetical protein